MGISSTGSTPYVESSQTAGYDEESLAGVDVSSKELAGGAKDNKIKTIAPLAL